MAQELGTLLRLLRTQAGLTQEKTAEISGVSVRTIRRLETGKANDHRLGTLHMLADALNAGPEDRQRLAAALTRTQTAPDTRPDPESPQPVGEIPETADEPSLPMPRSARFVTPIRGALAGAADELAKEVGRRWQREEEHRRVHDPFPLPVRWQEAPEFLTDHPANIQRLPSGAVPDQVDLSGFLATVAEFYQRISSGRLVVLGRAGSGKSILTIRFVLDYLETRASSLDRVPVIFSVGSWDPRVTTLRDWMVDRLLRDHPHLSRRTPGGGTLAAALIDADLVLPVLDGFDEIAEGLRRASLEALNSTSLPLVLTSRRGEFATAVQAAGAPLVWAAGIELVDLTLDDLVAYLPRTARPVAGGSGVAWHSVLAHLRAQENGTDVPLARVLRTPLMVILARTMYSEAPGEDATELLDTAWFPDENSLEDHLLAGFVPTVYRRRVAELTAGGHPHQERNRDPARAERWLGYLAHHLAGFDREQQDLAWWRISDSLRPVTRVLATVLTSAVCIAVSVWLVGGVPLSPAPGEILLMGALMGAGAGLAFGSAYAVVTSFGGKTFEPTQVRLRLPGTGRGVGRRPFRTFITRFATVLLGGFVMGVGCACGLAFLRWLYDGIPLTNDAQVKGMLINMVGLGLIFGLGAGVVFGLLAALEAPLDVTSAATPGSLLSSNRSTVIRQVLVLVPALTLTIAVGGYLFTHLLQGLFGPMNWELADGVVGGLGGASSYVLSFTAWGRWVVLCRVLLPLTGRLPWDMAAFLDDAYRRGVLRQTGAVYQFRHIRLQHHLARTFREQHAGYASARFPRQS